MANEKLLTEEQEVEAYISHKAGKSVKEVADEFGVSPSTIDRTLRAVAARKISVVLDNLESLETWEDQAWASMKIMQLSVRIKLAVALHFEGVTTAGATSSAKLHDILKLVAVLEKGANSQLSLFVRIYGQYQVQSAIRPRQKAPPKSDGMGPPPATAAATSELDSLLSLDDAGDALDLLLKDIDLSSPAFSELNLDHAGFDVSEMDKGPDELFK